MPRRPQGNKISRRQINRMLGFSPQMDALARRKARLIVTTAIAVFNAQQRFDNEWRLSETTPPKYVASFKIERVRRGDGLTWIVRNTDPGAVWVEFGAHAGGRTFVLRYRPLGRALDIVGAMEV